MSMWIIETFRMSVDVSCVLLVYMTILMNYWKEYSIIFCIINGLVMYLFRLTLKPSRSQKIFITKQVYILNLEPTLMALPFGDTWCAIRTSPIGWSQHQHLRLIRTQHYASVKKVVWLFTVICYFLPFWMIGSSVCITTWFEVSNVLWLSLEKRNKFSFRDLIDLLQRYQEKQYWCMVSWCQG